jgi:hypothetical protein
MISCKKNPEMPVSDIEKLRNNNNKNGYPEKQMDSVEAINFITKQKVQEVLDLSALYLSGNRDTKIDSVIFNQMKSYFYEPDSTTFQPLFEEMQKLNVKNAKVNHLEVYKEIVGKDTLDRAKFNVEYFDSKNKSLGNFDKNAGYILVSMPIQFKKEFKFYFLEFYSKPVKDSVSAGVTR